MTPTNRGSLAPEARRSLLRIVGLYSVVAMAWIVWSDSLMGLVTVDPRYTVFISMAKGLGFVLVTAGILAFVLRRGFLRLARTEAARESTASRMTAIADTLPGGLYMTDTQGDIVYCNRALLDLFDLADLPPGANVGKMTGWQFKDWSGRPIPGTEMPAHVAMSRGESILDRRYLIETPGGRQVYVTANASPLRDRDGTVMGAIVAVNDLTRLQLQRAELERRGHVLTMITTVAREISRVPPEKELMETVCRAIVEEGGFRLAAIGMVGDDPARTIRIGTACGAAADVIRRQRIEAIPGPHGNGPTGRAVREKRPVYLGDIETDPSFAPWREAALMQGMRSCASLPLVDDRGNAFGVLLTYDGRPEAFREGEAILLEGLARDLAYGLVSGRAHEARRLAETRYEKMLTGVLQAMARLLEIRDPYTAGHEMRTAQVTVAIAREMGLDASTIEGLRIAAELHDIGKLVVPAEILSRPSRLSDTEREIVKQHVVLGEEVLGAIEFPWPIATIVGQHHERLDGTGYPRGLSGDQIRLESRILAVADTYEAVTSHRPYRPARSHEEAIAELRQGAGTRYDNHAIDALARVVARHGADTGRWVRYEPPKGADPES